MNLSLSLIVENLLDYDAQLIETDEKKFSFSGVQILTQPTEALDPDTLYVCTPRVLPRLKKSLFEDHCFVFKARPQQIRCSHALHGVMLGEDSDLNQVINRLISLFSDFHTFEYSIKEASLSRQGYEPFFPTASSSSPTPPTI